MTGRDVEIGGRTCAVCRDGPPRVLLLQPVDRRELPAAEELARCVRQMTEAPFALCAFPVEDWSRDLSPWPAPAVYGEEPFGGGAALTLAYVSDVLLPAAEGIWGPVKTVLGGYSLAGLFALWCGYETDLFAAVAAASPSVWFDGWEEYAAGRPMGAQAVYLSLGDREEKTGRKRLARVGDCIRAQKDLLDAAGVPSELVWEPGSHFRNVRERMARGFAWAAERVGGGPARQEMGYGQGLCDL